MTVKFSELQPSDTLGVPRVLQFDFAFDTPNLDIGVPVYTPVVGEYLLDSWFHTTEAWDGTTPWADLGTGGGSGMFAYWGLNPGCTLTGAAITNSNFGLQCAFDYLQSYTANVVGAAADAGAGASSSSTQLKFVSTDPLKLWVTQDGLPGGDPIGGSSGAASLHLLIVSPVLLNP